MKAFIFTAGLVVFFYLQYLHKPLKVMSKSLNYQGLRL
jgi:hypothetical protein